MPVYVKLREIVSDYRKSNKIIIIKNEYCVWLFGKKHVSVPDV